MKFTHEGEHDSDVQIQMHNNPSRPYPLYPNIHGNEVDTCARASHMASVYQNSFLWVHASAGFKLCAQRNPPSTMLAAFIEDILSPRVFGVF
jgi:hypothetical protein